MTEINQNVQEMIHLFIFSFMLNKCYPGKMITPVVNLLKVKLEDWLVHSTAFTPVLIGLTITIENEEYRALSFKR